MDDAGSELQDPHREAGVRYDHRRLRPDVLRSTCLGGERRGAPQARSVPRRRRELDPGILSLTAKPPSEAALKKFKDIDETTLADLLGLSARAGKSLKITGTRLVIYQYEAAKRQPEAEPPSEDELVAHEHPTLELPPLPASIMEDDHYVSALVHFELGTSKFPQLNWRAIIDVATGAVLHLRPFVDDVKALVFEEDPDYDGARRPLPSATSALLNPKRVKVPLQGLNPPANATQALQGAIVKLTDPELPPVALPI